MPPISGNYYNSKYQKKNKPEDYIPRIIVIFLIHRKINCIAIKLKLIEGIYKKCSYF